VGLRGAGRDVISVAGGQTRSGALDAGASDDDAHARRAGALLGRAVASCKIVQGGGYTPARRLLVSFVDGSSAFVKVAVSDMTAEWLRDEARNYDWLGPRPFLPRLLAFDDGDDARRPLLILEDLSGARWPPPWRGGDWERVLETLASVAACGTEIPLGAGLPRLEDQRALLASWGRVAEDPAPFLSLGLCNPVWLDSALPILLRAEANAPLDGDDLLHNDVRSDNLCFARPSNGAGERVVLVDWNMAGRGNGAFDVATFLPSLHAEGGPAPETILPDAPGFAAILAGYWAARAGLAPPPLAPRVRVLQRTVLAVALPWAARALGLPAPVAPLG